MGTKRMMRNRISLVLPFLYTQAIDEHNTVGCYLSLSSVAAALMKYKHSATLEPTLGTKLRMEFHVEKIIIRIATRPRRIEGLMFVKDGLHV